MKIVDEVALDSAITSLADAIRTRGHFSSKMTFPDGFISAISSGTFYSGQTKYVMPEADNQIIYPDNGYNGIEKLVVYGDGNLISSNIKIGISIFGITGDWAANMNSYIDGTTTAEGDSRVTAIPPYFYFARSMLTDVAFSHAINLGGYAFYACLNLVRASFNRVEYIGVGCFSGCTSIENVYIPACEIIYADAFHGCISLKNISIPECSTIGPSAFCGCRSIENVYIPACEIIYDDAFLNCISLKNISIPECSTIGSSAFWGCTSIENVYIPACEIIYGNAFRVCGSIKNISIPACSIILYGAFAFCSSLETIEANSLTKIYNEAFEYCKSIKSIYFLGNSVATLLNSNAFYETPIAGLSSEEFEYGSIYVPADLYQSYMSATNWSYYSARIVGMETDL